MVVGGNPKHREYIGNVWGFRPSEDQIVDLSQQPRSCPSLTKYPINPTNSATGAIVSGNPIICGGACGGGSRLNTCSECYQHNKDLNTWTLLTNMTNKRASSASVPLNGNLWVIGGLDSDRPEDDYSLSSTEYVSPDGNASQPGPELPSSQYGHCAVKLSTGQVMLLGGYIPRGMLEKSVIIFDPDTETFNTSLPSLKYARRYFGCAVFNSTMHDNREVVLAAGGWNQATAEILDYTQPNAIWTESKY